MIEPSSHGCERRWVKRRNGRARTGALHKLSREPKLGSQDIRCFQVQHGIGRQARPVGRSEIDNHGGQQHQDPARATEYDF